MVLGNIEIFSILCLVFFVFFLVYLIVDIIVYYTLSRGKNIGANEEKIMFVVSIIFMLIVITLVLTGVIILFRTIVPKKSISSAVSQRKTDTPMNDAYSSQVTLADIPLTKEREKRIQGQVVTLQDIIDQ